MSGTKGCHALESNMGKKNNPKYNLDMFLSKIYHSYAFLSKDFFGLLESSAQLTLIICR